MTRTVAIIGGGITGIAAALEATNYDANVHLFEASPKFGGKIAETEVDGKLIPTAPDAFLARRPEMIELAELLGLNSVATTPAAGSPRIYRNGQLYSLPPNVLGIPATADLSPGLLSAEGIAEMSQDLDAPASTYDDDESAGTLVRRRLGDEALEYLVDPLLGGINAGDSDQLSIVSGVPALAALRSRCPSLIESAAKTLEGAKAKPGPVFQSVTGGLNRLVDTAINQLVDAGVTLHLGSPATLRQDAGQWHVESKTSETVRCDDVIVTTPAHVTSQLLQDVSRDAAHALLEIDYSSVALTILILPAGTIDIDPSISGVLVPRQCGLHITAVSFASHKWPELASGGEQILRVSVGRRTHTSWQELSDSELADQIRADLSEIFGTAIAVGPTHVARWMRSLPQYDVGHRDKIRAIDTATNPFGGLVLTGAWRDGLGLPACAGAGKVAAQQLFATS